MQLAFQKLCKIYIYYGTFKATCYSVIHVTSHEGLRVSVPNLIVVSQTVWAHGDPPEKLGLSRLAFQGHSRSLNLTTEQWVSMTY